MPIGFFDFLRFETIQCPDCGKSLIGIEYEKGGRFGVYCPICKKDWMYKSFNEYKLSMLIKMMQGKFDGK